MRDQIVMVPVRPGRLKALALALGHTVQPIKGSRFDAVGHTITAVDGIVIETLKRMAKPLWTPKSGGKHLSADRLHTHFEALSGRAVRGSLLRVWWP